MSEKYLSVECFASNLKHFVRLADDVDDDVLIPSECINRPSKCHQELKEKIYEDNLNSY